MFSAVGQHHSAVAVAEDVVALPRQHLEVAVLEHRREGRLDQGLTGLAVAAHVGRAVLVEQFADRRCQGRVARSEVHERHAEPRGGVRVDRGGADRAFVVGVECSVESRERAVGGAEFQRRFGRTDVDADHAVEPVLLLELAQVGFDLRDL